MVEEILKEEEYQRLKEMFFKEMVKNMKPANMFLNQGFMEITAQEANSVRNQYEFAGKLAFMSLYGHDVYPRDKKYTHLELAAMAKNVNP